MMEVLLIHPPRSFVDVVPGAAKTFRPPLGVLYLAATLEKEGVSVGVVDSLAECKNLEETIDVVKREKPMIVGISATSTQVRGALELGRRLKDLDVVVCLGGAHVSADPDFIKRFPYFDFAIIGEGEITFPKLVKKVLKGEKVKGVYIGEISKDLDALPYPARHLINYKNYMIEEYGSEFINLIANRGCPFNCVYCSSPVMGKCVRLRSPQSIIEEMETCMRKRKVRAFIFEDDTLTLNREQIVKLCEMMLERGIKTEWTCVTRVDLVDEELLRKMREAGCIEIGFGVESGNDRVRNEIVRKGVSREQIFKAFELCSKVGIKTDAFFMLGFPTEGKKEIEDTIEMASSLKADLTGIHLSVPMPGSDLYKSALKEGVIPREAWDDYTTGKSDVPIYVPMGLSIDYLKTARIRAYKKIYFTPRFVFKRILHDLKRPDMIFKDLSLALSIYKYGRPSTGRE